MCKETIKSHIGDARNILDKFKDFAREFAKQEAEEQGMNGFQAFFFVRAETKRIMGLSDDFKSAIRQTRSTMEDPYVVFARVAKEAPRTPLTMKEILTANRFFQRLERHA